VRSLILLVLALDSYSGYTAAARLILYVILGIGLSLFVAELTGVYFTGGSLNPARSFGPAVVNTSFVHYHWIYWLGPILGSIVAAGFYKFIKILEYESANPNQDTDHAAKVQRKKKLLMAAGINEADAHQVANELHAEAQAQREAPSSAGSEKTVVGGGHNGGPDGRTMANGQGRSSLDTGHDEVKYGTAFRSGSTSSGLDGNVHEQRPGGPGLVGRYSYLGKRGGRPVPLLLSRSSRTDSPAMPSHNDVHSANNMPDEALGGMVAEEPRNRFVNVPVNRTSRTDSPAMPSHNDVYATTDVPDEALGGMVADEPRNRFARTPSSGV
jgi:aquaporin rerated protein, other eukaryote